MESILMYTIHIWMQENLKATHYRNGDAISNITNNDDWGSADEGQYGVYDNDPSNSDIYGNLYNWAAVNDERDVCPEGFHVPSDYEYIQLEMFLGMTDAEANNSGWRGNNEGSKLAGNASLWNDGNLEYNTEFGSTGFNAIAAGGRLDDDGNYYDASYNAQFWTSTPSANGFAWYRIINYDND